MRAAKRSESGGEPLAREEWDFSTIPPGELKACFLYEYARESPTILAIAQEMEGYQYTDFSDQLEPNFRQLRRHNDKCAILLANIGGDLRLATTPWQAILPKKREFLASYVEEIGSFTKVPFEDARWWEEDKRQYPKKIRELKTEVVSFRIDWEKPLRQVEKDAVAWIRKNQRCTRTRGRRGRHAKEHAKYNDALRRLGALRLWARHTLKQVIEVAKSHRVKFYSDYPGHQTAWENGVKGVLKLMQDTFRLSEAEMPLSWQQLKQKPRKQK